MSDLIEQLLEGKLSEDKINFFSYHFQDRLRDNKLDLDYVKNQILHEKNRKQPKLADRQMYSYPFFQERNTLWKPMRDHLLRLKSLNSP